MYLEISTSSPIPNGFKISLKVTQIFSKSDVLKRGISPQNKSPNLGWSPNMPTKGVFESTSKFCQIINFSNF